MMDVDAKLTADCYVVFVHDFDYQRLRILVSTLNLEQMSDR